MVVATDKKQSLLSHYKTRFSASTITIVLILILAIIFILSFGFGHYSISPVDVIKILASKIFPIQQTWPDVLNTIVINVRLPRIVAAVLVGGGLSLAGVCFQGLFRNPLVSPDILGVSSGASLGAALGILASGNNVVIELMAFGAAMLTMFISYSISRAIRGNATLSLILAGIAIGSLLSASLSFIKYIADTENELPAITYWLMGGFTRVGLSDILFAAIPMIICMIILVLIRWRFNVLAMGEEEAMALGINTTKLRLIIILCGATITATAVSISGTIGWVGLVIPHIGRMLVGPDHKKLIPVTLLLGAIFLLLVDNVARVVFSIEIPIGILTSLMGVPFFLYLLLKRKKGWS